MWTRFGTIIGSFLVTIQVSERRNIKFNGWFRLQIHTKGCRLVFISFFFSKQKKKTAYLFAQLEQKEQEALTATQKDEEH